MEPSSLSSVILLRLPSSPVRTQLMLTIPSWGPGAPYPQSGVPFPKIRVYSLPKVQNNTIGAFYSTVSDCNKKKTLFCTFCQKIFCNVVYKRCTRTKDNDCNPVQVFWTPTPAPWPGAAWPTTASWTWWPPSNGSQRTSPSSAAIRVWASRWLLLL